MRSQQPRYTINVTMQLDEQHKAALEELAGELDMTQSAVVRAALRLYQMVHQRAKAGERFVFIDRHGNKIKGTPLGVPALEKV